MKDNCIIILNKNRNLWLLLSLSAKIASMSISELLPNRPAAAMIPDDNNARSIILSCNQYICCTNILYE